MRIHKTREAEAYWTVSELVSVASHLHDATEWVARMSRKIQVDANENGEIYDGAVFEIERMLPVVLERVSKVMLALAKVKDLTKEDIFEKYSSKGT